MHIVRKSNSKIYFTLFLMTLLSACGSSSNETSTSNRSASANSQPNNSSKPSTSNSPANPSTTPSTNPQDAKVPEFGLNRKLTVIASSSDKLDVPRDLAFDPDHPDELWIANRGFSGMVIVYDAGTNKQHSEKRVDYYADHFMAEVSSLSFGANNTFATCQENRNEMNPSEPDFMGPTLWSADLSIFAKVNQGTNGKEGSHIDMLHESPLCMGIVHDTANVYWAFDGLHNEIVRYDFQKDHGPGNTDHSDGIIRRYPEVSLTRVDGIVGHLAFDHDSKWLYAADTGGHRVVRFKTDSGKFSKNLSQPEEQIQEYSEYRGVTVETFIANGLTNPSGIAIYKGRLFVSDHSNGNIVAFDLSTGKVLDQISTGAKGVMGLTISPDGKLWYVDADTNTVVRVDPL